MSSADRVLVCDDDARSVRAPRVVLRAGFRVVACASAEDALDAAALRMPAAAIVELAVPDADGVALVRKLREWSTIPIVVLRRAVYRDGEEVHLTPIEFTLLGALLRHRGRLLTHEALLHQG